MASRAGATGSVRVVPFNMEGVFDIRNNDKIKVHKKTPAGTVSTVCVVFDKLTKAEKKGSVPIEVSHQNTSLGGDPKAVWERATFNFKPKSK